MGEGFAAGACDAGSQPGGPAGKEPQAGRQTDASAPPNPLNPPYPLSPRGRLADGVAQKHLSASKDPHPPLLLQPDRLFCFLSPIT